MPTTYNVSSGVTSSGITLNSGDVLNVSSGGRAISTTVSSGGVEVVYSGGTTISTTINSRGYEYVSSGGTASGTTLNSGGTEFVSSGGTASGTVVSGGVEVVAGTATGTVVSSGGGEFVEGGGTARGTMVNGFEYVSSGGTASGTVVSGGVEVVASGGTASGTVVSGGVEIVYSGGTTISTTINSRGYEYVSSGGTASGTTLNSGGYEFVFAGGSATSTTVNSGGTEFVFPGGTARGTMVSSGGSIDLPNLTFSGVTSAALNSVTDILTVTEGGGSYQQQLSGSYTGLVFGAAQDIGGGTVLTLEAAAPCYVTSTRILTETGEVAVEALKTGDRLMLHDGYTAPIIWIGHRRIDCVRHPNPNKVWPVRISADAFGSKLPHRDLWLSPDHAVFVDDVLIPIKHLINGTTIAQVPVNEVTYYHIELDQHDVLLAEGLSAESYLDTGDRRKFSNGDEAISLFPDFSSHSPDAIAIWEAFGCAPLIVTGPELRTVRQRLDEQAAVLARKEVVRR